MPTGVGPIVNPERKSYVRDRKTRPAGIRKYDCEA
jgi:hypothetical protein